MMKKMILALSVIALTAGCSNDTEKKVTEKKSTEQSDDTDFDRISELYKKIQAIDPGFAQANRFGVRPYHGSPISTKFVNVGSDNFEGYHHYAVTQYKNDEGRTTYGKYYLDDGSYEKLKGREGKNIKGMVYDIKDLNIHTGSGTKKDPYDYGDQLMYTGETPKAIQERLLKETESYKKEIAEIEGYQPIDADLIERMNDEVIQKEVEFISIRPAYFKHAVEWVDFIPDHSRLLKVRKNGAVITVPSIDMTDAGYKKGDKIFILVRQPRGLPYDVDYMEDMFVVRKKNADKNMRTEGDEIITNISVIDHDKNERDLAVRMDKAGY